ncbi:MAG: metallophosphoesterase [Clostridia bacterium]|nr:metallophosphoesterase [Clostridia bacterium]
MKNIVVISDTHGRKNCVEELYPVLREADFVIHLGDGWTDLRDFNAEHPEKTYLCKGNCDVFPALKEYELEVENVKIFFCHGDKYRVKSDFVPLAQEAKKRGCKVALYGHTHIPDIRTVDGVLLINPGSLRYPANRGGSYAYISISGEKACPVIVGDNE